MPRPARVTVCEPKPPPRLRANTPFGAAQSGDRGCDQSSLDALPSTLAACSMEELPGIVASISPACRRVGCVSPRKLGVSTGCASAGHGASFSKGPPSRTLLCDDFLFRAPSAAGFASRGRARRRGDCVVFVHIIRDGTVQSLRESAMRRWRDGRHGVVEFWFRIWRQRLPHGADVPGDMLRGGPILRARDPVRRRSGDVLRGR